MDDKRIIDVKYLSTLFTYIDTSYAVHPDTSSHTGGLITFGNSKAPVQKLNVKSSMELEVVGLSEYLSYKLWMGIF